MHWRHIFRLILLLSESNLSQPTYATTLIQGQTSQSEIKTPSETCDPPSSDYLNSLSSPVCPVITGSLCVKGVSDVSVFNELWSRSAATYVYYDFDMIAPIDKSRNMLDLHPLHCTSPGAHGSTGSAVLGCGTYLESSGVLELPKDRNYEVGFKIFPLNNDASTATQSKNNLSILSLGPLVIDFNDNSRQLSMKLPGFVEKKYVITIPVPLKSRYWNDVRFEMTDTSRCQIIAIINGETIVLRNTEVFSCAPIRGPVVIGDNSDTNWAFLDDVYVMRLTGSRLPNLVWVEKGMDNNEFCPEGFEECPQEYNLSYGKITKGKEDNSNLSCCITS